MSSQEGMVEGTEEFLRITNGLRSEDLEDFLTKMMYEYPDEVVYAALDLRGEWEADSNTPVCLALEKYVAELLQVEYKHYHLPRYAITELTKIQQQAVIAIYDVTQRLLIAKQVTHLVLYRGMGWSLSECPEWLDDATVQGQLIQFETRTLSSWTFSQDIAVNYAKKHEIGYVFKAVVPVDRIFAIIDLDHDQESVCISHNVAEVFLIVKGSNRDD